MSVLPHAVRRSAMDMAAVKYTVFFIFQCFLNLSGVVSLYDAVIIFSHKCKNLYGFINYVITFQKNEFLKPVSVESLQCGNLLKEAREEIAL